MRLSCCRFSIAVIIAITIVIVSTVICEHRVFEEVPDLTASHKTDSKKFAVKCYLT